jgi:hypothetical protein
MTLFLAVDGPRYTALERFPLADNGATQEWTD